MAEWTPIKMQMAEQMWNVEKRGATYIARVLGLTRNQVLGMRRREGWESRESPIIRGGYVPRARTARAASEPENRGYVPVLGLRPAASAAPRRRVGTVKECAYPSGDTLPFTFCGEPTQPGSSYCALHHRVCYSGVALAEDRRSRTGRVVVATGQPFNLPK